MSTRGSRPAGFRAVRGACGVSAALLLLTACSSGSDKLPTPSLSSPAPSPSTPSVAPAPASSSAPPEAVLPQGCSQLLPLGEVQRALGAPLRGQTTYLRAAPVPQSGRTGRVTCGYGVPMSAASAPAGATVTPTPTPVGRAPVQVSYITYTDEQTAVGRVQLTVQNDSKTASLTQAQVDGKKAFVLLGSEWNELLMADGPRTIVVEIAPALLPPDKAPAALVAMASVMLKFGAPPSSGSPSATS